MGLADSRRATPLYYSHLQRPYFRIRPHSEILGVRAEACHLVRQFNPLQGPICSLLSLTVLKTIHILKINF